MAGPNIKPFLGQNFGGQQFPFNRDRPHSSEVIHQRRHSSDVKREVDAKHDDVIDDDFDDDDTVGDQVTTSAMISDAQIRHDVSKKSDGFDDLDEREENDALGHDSGTNKT